MQRMRQWMTCLQVGLGMTLLAVAGCGDAGGPPTESAPPPAAKSETPVVPPAAEAKPAVAAKEVELKLVDLAGLQHFLDEQRGKIVVMDVWATWCIPCRQKFPKFVELSKKMGDKAVFVTLSIDDASEAEEAKGFLVEKHSLLNNFLATTELSEVQEKFKFEGVPHYFVFGKDGQPVAHGDDLEKVAGELNALVK